MHMLIENKEKENTIIYMELYILQAAVSFESVHYTITLLF